MLYSGGAARELEPGCRGDVSHAADFDGAAQGAGGGGWGFFVREDQSGDAAYGGRQGVSALCGEDRGWVRGGQAAAGGAQGGFGGRLRIGASPGVGTYALPGLLERFAAAHPRVSISVRTGHSEAILEMTLKEEVQLGLTRAMRHPEVESLPLYEDELVLVVDPGHRFTRRGVASLTEIGDEQLIFFDHDSSYFEQTHALFRNAGIRELRTMEVDNIEAAKRMVEHRLGVAFLPRTAVVRSVSSGNLVLVSIEENPEMSRSIVALKRRDVPRDGPRGRLPRGRRRDGREAGQHPALPHPRHRVREFAVDRPVYVGTVRLWAVREPPLRYEGPAEHSVLAPARCGRR